MSSEGFAFLFQSNFKIFSEPLSQTSRFMFCFSSFLSGSATWALNHFGEKHKKKHWVTSSFLPADLQKNQPKKKIIILGCNEKMLQCYLTNRTWHPKESKHFLKLTSFSLSSFDSFIFFFFSIYSVVPWILSSAIPHSTFQLKQMAIQL